MHGIIVGGQQTARSHYKVSVVNMYVHMRSSCASAECMNIAHAQSPGHSIYVYTHELRTREPLTSSIEFHNTHMGKDRISFGLSNQFAFVVNHLKKIHCCPAGSLRLGSVLVCPIACSPGDCLYTSFQSCLTVPFLLCLH